MYSEEELLALSGIQHIAFCPRQWALIHIERLWQENVRTVEGRLLHERADNPFMQESRGNLIIARSVPLSSYTLGLYGVADVIEFKRLQGNTHGIPLNGYEGMWAPHPVEYKRGKPKSDERDRVQLCAQAICLEEAYSIVIGCGSLYYGETRHREHVEFDRELRRQVQILADDMHRLFSAGHTPKASPGKHCKQCSLIDLCLPKVSMKRLSVKQYLQDTLKESSQSGNI